ncbi:unnamed protein product [Leptidea sinapis]|uniref:Uncharacterized protein n=1 Tax=Leptidea sinapis TaxID=189913 RepID=A0A5E4Q6B2_9NEOP|nr:unnamed protein product [Leptidea sinapis]
MVEMPENKLGEKHKYINYAVRESLKNNLPIQEIENDDDMKNIIKIDVASSRRDIDFILKVLTGKDMLYISRAIKQSKWLVDDEFSHIINPEYIHKILIPDMTSKAANKLFKYIKLNLKNSKRVEDFYNYEELKKAADWLPYCSAEFIEANFTKHVELVDMSLLRRLCEKSFKVLEIFTECENVYNKKEGLQETIFLLKKDLDRYLNIVEKLPQYSCPKFNKSFTEFIMKEAPERVMKKYKFYSDNVETAVFVKHLERKNIKKFILELYQDDETNRSFYMNVSRMNIFIKAMPDGDRFEFVKQVYIDRVYKADESLPKPLRDAMSNLFQNTSTRIHKQYWYRFTPFNYAFSEIQKNIYKDTSCEELSTAIASLVIAASRERDNLLLLLNYIRKNYSNCAKNLKQNIVQSIISESDFHKFDRILWNIFESYLLENINEDTDENNSFIEPIIVYYALHGLQLPGLVEEKFKFTTLKSYQKNLRFDEKDKVFFYLHNIIIKKINSYVVSNEEELKYKVQLLENILDVITDWSKELNDFPIILTHVKDMLKSKEDNSWKVEFNSIYNKKKSWRRLFFNESLKMNPTQPVFINALKHDPVLLLSECKIKDTSYFDKIISPALVYPQQLFLKKVKVYWFQTIAKIFSDKYKSDLININNNQNHVTRALCLLLPRDELKELLHKYAPQEDAVINDLDSLTLNIQKNFAKSMHISRPQPTPETVMCYLNEGYLPYTLPSLYAIFLNLNTIESQINIPKLFNTRVSLQKHGIRLAFLKLNPDQITDLLSEVLKTTKNVSIRHVAFSLTHKFLCSQKDATKIQKTWQVLESFLDTITFKENSAVYDTLFKIQDIPDIIKPKYYIKTYKFLKQLIEQDDQEKYRSSFTNYFIGYARELIETLCPKFITEVLQENEDSFIQNKYYYMPLVELISAHMLCAKNEDEEIQKYNQFLSPLIKKCFKHWDDVDDSKNYYVRANFKSLLVQLCNDLKIIVFKKHMISPVRLFKLIQTDMDTLSAKENYLIKTKWQLTVLFVELIGEEAEWDTLVESISEKYSKGCIDILKKHCKQYFEQIYITYSKALHSVTNCIMTHKLMVKFCKQMLDDKSNIVYMSVMRLLQRHFSHYVPDDSKSDIKDICQTILSYDSTEIQIHYYQFYKKCLQSYM